MIKPKAKRCKACLTLYNIEKNGKCTWCNNNKNINTLILRSR